MTDFPAVIDLGSLDGVTGFRIDGAAVGDQLGRGLVALGDINGDGYADFMISAPGADPSGRAQAGSTYVIYGGSSFASTFSLTSLNGVNGFRIDGRAAGDLLGASSSAGGSQPNTALSGGDFNGDGLIDLLIGAGLGDPGGRTSAGYAHVVFGQAAPWAASLDLSAMAPGQGFRINGVAAGDVAGYSVSGAGDVNGDGFDDIVIGARGTDTNATNSGSTYVIFGGCGCGFGDQDIDLSSLDGSNGFVLNGVTGNAGYSVTSAGDINGDGFADIVIGASRAAVGSLANAGAVYVVYGSAFGFSSSYELSALDGTDGFRIDALSAGDWLGSAIASGGDFNGDGVDDLLIGASLGDAGASNSGESYVIFGDADGFGAAFDLTSLNGTNGFRIDGVAATDRSATSLSFAGDVNGDGFDDLIVGAHYADPNGDASAGAAYVVFGSAGGFSADLDLSSLNGENGFRLEGVGANDRAGFTVSAAGDVNGDGFDDLMIGAWNSNNATGSTYIVYGRAPTTGVARTGTGADQRILGGDFNDVLNGEGGDDLLEGRGGDDILNGGDGSDILDGGAGADALNGGDGIDAVTYENSEVGVNVHLTLGGLDGDAQGDTFTGIEDIIGSYYGDLIAGNDGANWISGGWGDDLIEGRGGDDIIDGGVGEDLMIGGDGIDTLTYLTAGIDNDATFALVVNLHTGHGTSYEFSAYLGDVDEFSGFENVVGSAYADWITGDGASNFLVGWFGDDILEGGAGADILFGDAGFDMASYASSGTGVTVSLFDGIAEGGDAEGDVLVGVESLYGSAYDDNLTGDLGDDTIQGGAGADVLDGLHGFDTLSYAHSTARVVVNIVNNTARGGHAEGDVISGFESVIGSSYSDILNGGVGSQTMEGGGGNDLMNGGSGIDTVSYANTYGFEFTIDLEGGFATGAGNDRIYGFENVIGSDGTDEIYGTSGDNVFEGLAGGDGLYGRGGFDTADYSDSDEAVLANLATQTGSGGHAQGDVYDSIEGLIGSAFDDSLVGDGGNNRLEGREGADHLEGGGGEDVASYANSIFGVTVDLEAGTGAYGDADGDTLSGIEHLVGSADGDILMGDGGANRFEGGLGGDYFNGRGGADWVVYSAAASRIVVDLLSGVGSLGEAAGDQFVDIENALGSVWGDRLSGSLASNHLSGAAGSDLLQGRGGDDVLEGGTGDDRLNGGTGADTFVFGDSDGQDVIQEFSTTSGDVISFTGTLFSGFADVMSSATDDGLGNCVISRNGASITLTGVLKSQLSADDFAFAGAPAPALSSKAGTPLVLPGLGDQDPFVLVPEQASKAGEQPEICWGDLPAQLAGGDPPHRPTPDDVGLSTFDGRDPYRLAATHDFDWLT